MAPSQSLLPLHQPQQEEPHPRLQGRAGPRDLPQADPRGGCAGGELSRDGDGSRRAQLGHPDPVEPALDLRPALRLRLRRPVSREGRLRPDRPGHGRHHARHRRAGRSPHLGGAADLRPRHRHVGRPGRAGRALRAAAHRPGSEDRVLAARDRGRLLLLDQRGLAGRPRGAGADGLAPPPERALSALRDQGRLHKDGYMMIGASGQSIWERCARALGHPEWLADPRFAKATERRKNRFALEKEIVAVLVTAPTAHWTKVLDDAGVPCGPVYNYEQLFSDPQVKHREMVVHADDAELGRVPHIRTPIRMSAAAVAVRRTAPRLGQHTDETLGNASRTVQLPDNPLSPRGLAQAERLAKRLEREGISAVLASDLARAAQTAEQLARVTGTVVRHDPLLQERNFGDIRGTPYADLGFDMFAPDYAPPNGETWEVFHARVDRAWALVQASAAATPGHLAVVTHGLVCRSLAARPPAGTGAV